MKLFKLRFKFVTLLSILIIIGISVNAQKVKKAIQIEEAQDSIKNKTIAIDSTKVIPPLKLNLAKKKAHASYYADKFNGKRTASGRRFDNNKYTAAHRKFPFGTKLKITNEANGKSVIVEVTDRGPFTRGRDIDLTKRAFTEITSKNWGGSLIVKIEEIKD